MVASELLENAIKYGDHSRAGSGLEVVLEVDDRTIEVRVTSGVGKGEHVERLSQRVREVTEACAPESHYIHRVSEFMSDSEQSGGLGIYRIKVEGEFMLSVRIENDALTVVATRRSP